MEDTSARAARWPRWAAGAEPDAPTSARAAQPWCRIVAHADGYALQFGGGAEAGLRERLEALKGAVPAPRRRWDAASRTWWIEPVVEDLFRVLTRWTERWFEPDRIERAGAPESAAAAWSACADTGEAVDEGWVPEPARPEPARHGRPDRPEAEDAGPRPWPPAPAVPDALAAAYVALWLQPGAPPALVKAAYRTLAALHHPDVGGDVATMQRVNAAYAALQRAAS